MLGGRRPALVPRANEAEIAGCISWYILSANPSSGGIAAGGVAAFALWRGYWPDGFEGGPVPAALVAVMVKV